MSRQIICIYELLRQILTVYFRKPWKILCRESVFVVILLGVMVTVACHDAQSTINLLDTLEQEIMDIEMRLVHKTQEYLHHAQQLRDFRKRRYRELCRKKLTQLLATFQQRGIYPSKTPNAYRLSAPLTSPEGYLLAIVDPQEAFEKQIGEAASSWSTNPFLGTKSPCIFVMLPQPGCGNTLSTRYLSSKGELEPLLAHEIGHLWKFHDHEINRYIDHWNTHMYLVAGGVAGALIAACIAYNKHRLHQDHNHKPESVVTAIVAGGIIVASSMALLHAKIKQFSRRQELEADQFVAALGETGLQQFIITLVRWYLNDQLHALLDPAPWMPRQLEIVKRAVNYVKKRLFGTHPSHEKRLFHLILTWRTMKTRDIMVSSNCEEMDAYVQAKNSITTMCLKALDDIPELQLRNIPTTLAVNFPHKILILKERNQLEQLLEEIRQDFIDIIDKALNA